MCFWVQKNARACLCSQKFNPLWRNNDWCVPLCSTAIHLSFPSVKTSISQPILTPSSYRFHSKTRPFSPSTPLSITHSPFPSSSLIYLVALKCSKWTKRRQMTSPAGMRLCSQPTWSQFLLFFLYSLRAVYVTAKKLNVWKIEICTWTNPIIFYNRPYFQVRSELIFLVINAEINHWLPTYCLIHHCEALSTAFFLLFCLT